MLRVRREKENLFYFFYSFLTPVLVDAFSYSMSGECNRFRFVSLVLFYSNASMFTWIWNVTSGSFGVSVGSGWKYQHTAEFLLKHNEAAILTQRTFSTNGSQFLRQSSVLTPSHGPTFRTSVCKTSTVESSVDVKFFFFFFFWVLVSLHRSCRMTTVAQTVETMFF